MNQKSKIENPSLKRFWILDLRFLIILFTFYFSLSTALAQSEYKIYYYSDSVKSSEGTLIDGKPDGYWKTYYQNGNLKSIGKRTHFLLDSIWNFYSPVNTIEKSITYFEGKKNGLYTEYYPSEKAKSKIMYVNDLREGEAEYYNEQGYLERKANYVHDKLEGQGFEFNNDSVIIAVLWYDNNILSSREAINRFDDKGRKVGTWMEFHANGNIKTESNYVEGQLNGIYKLFDVHQRLLRVGHYQGDSLLYSSSALEDFEEPFEKTEYYNDSTIKYRGSYKDVLPIGIHRFYNKDGSIDSCVLFDEIGTLLGKGVMLENGQKIGSWVMFYPSGAKQSEGNFVEDKKAGKWKFYYETGELKQEGYYSQGKPTSLWKWYYKTGELKKQEEYGSGKRNGLSIQYDISGQKIAEGMYVEDKRDGQWFIQDGDIIQKGSYVYGEKDKVWEHHFTNGQLQFKGLYFNTQPHKKHVYYYNNGKIEHTEYYKLGKPIKNWEFFDKDGLLLYTVYYKNGKEYKIVTYSPTDN